MHVPFLNSDHFCLPNTFRSISFLNEKLNFDITTKKFIDKACSKIEEHSIYCFKNILVCINTELFILKGHA